MLSACRSGSGRVSSDGLLGFTRAFLYAGAATVIAPLWDIPDEPTVRLAEEFYRQYKKGTAKSQALRAAQLKLLEDLRAGRVEVKTPAGSMTLPEHPGLWAGFVLQGAN
jgi:CHAT domain-containing protein